MNRLERLAPLTGIAAVGFFVAEAFVTGETPTIDDSVKDMVAFWKDHVRQQELGAGFMGLSAVAFVWFGASLPSAHLFRESGTWPGCCWLSGSRLSRS